MDLVDARIVTDNVAALAELYATVLGTRVIANDYYVELPTRVAALAICRRRFTEADGCGVALPRTAADRIILDFEVDDVDAAYTRLAPLTLTWVTVPADQPWGARSAMFRDGDGNLVNLFTRCDTSGEERHATE
ncbi:MAG TPA: VOC family protein [Acidimicrobiia bacterium]|nr:VOC family protein [Acidimicrobiia bacterium]